MTEAWKGKFLQPSMPEKTEFHSLESVWECKLQSLSLHDPSLACKMLTAQNLILTPRIPVLYLCLRFCIVPSV